jgi:hypothetical protein
MVDEPVFPNRGAQDSGLAASGNLFVVMKMSEVGSGGMQG